MTTILKKAVLNNHLAQTCINVTMYENKGVQENIVIKLELYSSNGSFINSFELEYKITEYRNATRKYLDILTEYC